MHCLYTDQEEDTDDKGRGRYDILDNHLDWLSGSRAVGHSDIDNHLTPTHKHTFSCAGGFDMVWETIANDAEDVSLLQSFADRGRHVTVIKTNNFSGEVETLLLVIQSVQVGNAVVNIGCGNVGVANQFVFATGGAVVEIEEPFRFPFADHVAAIGIGCIRFVFF